MGEAVSEKYWYDRDSPERLVLEALREYGRADLDMRRRMADGMEVGVTDTRALQLVIAAERQGVPATARDLATGLGITTASTAKLLNRLEESGHIRRTPNAADGRSVHIIATAHAHEEVRSRLGVMHERMREVTTRFSREEIDIIVRFLREMTQILDDAGSAPADGHRS